MEEEFEIPSAHEHAVEHAAEKRLPLGQEVALFSAVLATLGAIVSFLGGHTQNDALYYKNEAVLMKARASDTWAYYQAEGLKEHIAEQSAALIPAASAKYQADAARYASNAKSLRAQAETFDRQSEDADVESQHALHPHIKLTISMTALQIAIALASITALTRRRWLMHAAILFALLGIGLGILAWL
jgi:hypothetical protein